MNIEKAYEFIELNNYPFWRICYGDSNQVAARSKSDDEIQTEEIEFKDILFHLKKSLELLHPGTYSIYGRKDFKATNGMPKLIFSVHADIEKNNNLSPQQNDMLDLISGYKMQLIEAQNNTKIQQLIFEHKEELRQLEERLTKKYERQQDKPSTLDMVLSHVIKLPIFQQISNFEEMQQPQNETAENSHISGAENQNNNASEAEKVNLMINNALAEIAKVSQKDFLPLMQKLSDMAKNNPDTFNQYKNLFLNL